MSDYIIYTDTSKTDHAGTRERVFVKLIGDKDSTSLLELLRQNGNDFDTGKSSDFYFMRLPDVGELQKVEVTISQEYIYNGSNDAWLPNRIRVLKLAGNQVVGRWQAPCGKWIGDSRKPEDDEQLIRELQAMAEHVLV